MGYEGRREGRRSGVGVVLGLEIVAAVSVQRHAGLLCVLVDLRPRGIVPMPASQLSISDTLQQYECPTHPSFATD